MFAEPLNPGGVVPNTHARAMSCRIVLGAISLFARTTPVDAQSRPATLAASAVVGIDHLILGVDDLDRGMAEFARRTGVTPVKGGVHPGRGTQNALASLSDGRYLEILAPSHEAGVASDPRTSSATLTPVGWALHTSELRAVIAHMRSAGFVASEIRPGARARPDGVMLRWQTAAVSGAGLDDAPFFISWDADTPHPSTQSPTGCRFGSAAMTEIDPAPLAKFLATVAVQVPVTRGTVPHMTIVLVCPKGSIAFR